jgi:hypothetical protein
MRRLLLVFALLVASGFLLATQAFSTGQVSGDVYDELTEEPLSDRLVHAYNEPGGDLLGWAVTNDFGHYVIEGLAAGICYVWVYGGDGCSSEWWEDTPNAPEADPVNVFDGETTSGIDFGLPCGAGSGCIEGQVTDQGTGEPIHGAVIMVYEDPMGSPIADATTGELGYYEVCNLTVGVYYVYAHFPGCEGEWYLEKSAAEDADPVQVFAGEITDGISFTLTCESAYGCIVGRVTNEATGDPISGAYVRIFEDPYGDPVRDTYTGEQGYYDMCELEEGVYYVHAHAPGCEGEWFDDKYDPAQADPVQIIGGQRTEDIDFALDCGETPGSIMGRVIDRYTEEPIHEALVAVYADPFGEIIAQVYTGPDGYYDCDLDPGVYYAHAHAWECEGQWFNEKDSPEDADPFEVEAGQRTYGINFRLDCGHPGTGCITGRVTDEDSGEPINDALVRVYTDPESRPVAEAYTGEHGYYEICSLEPGIYYASAHARTCEREWFENQSSSEEADPIEVSSGTVVDGIDFSLTCGYAGTGCVVGRVTDEDGHAIRNAFVALLASPEGDPVYFTYTGEEGYYEICRVPAGIYYAFAHARRCEREWFENRERAEDADPFEVLAGRVTDGINFSLHCEEQELCIWGRVDDAEGEGIEGALVVAMMLDGSGARYTHTNIYGHYAICELTPDEYVVFAYAPGYVAEYYDNVYTWEGATPVIPPSDGINFSLRENARLDRTVMGKVFCGMGPAPRALVHAYSVDATSSEEKPVSSAVTGSDGSYKLEGLPDGTYRIEASRPGDPTTDCSELISVKGCSPEGVDIYLGTTLARLGAIAHGDQRELLLHAGPNPFRDRVRFSFVLPSGSHVKLEVFDLSGRSVAALVDETLSGGVYDVDWKASGIPSGIYISRLSCGEAAVTRKVVIAK